MGEPGRPRERHDEKEGSLSRGRPRSASDVDVDANADNVTGASCARDLFLAAFFDELGRSGARHVCVSPGSRSTPLTVAAFLEPSLRCWSLLDERGAGYFALGLAKASGRPVALICTSGTAAANYLPAVVEAHYARVPLLLLTADRPGELRGWGAGQTIDQMGLYGRHVRTFVEVPVPPAGGGEYWSRYARGLAARAVADAGGPPAGPVHLNWPLREPLEPTAAAFESTRCARTGADDQVTQGESTKVRGATIDSGIAAEDLAVKETHSGGLPARAQLDETLLALLANRVASCERGVIACGPMPLRPALAEAVAALAERSAWPILADPISGLRCGPHCGRAPVIGSADFLLRDPRFCAAHAPQIVLRLGDTPTSKALRLWLEAGPPDEFWLVDAEGGWREPSQLMSRVLRCDPEGLCRALAEIVPPRGESAWLRAFVGADGRATRVLAESIAGESALREPRAVREVARGLPGNALLYVANSMPVRDLDAFLPADEKNLRILANRGASGIDGLISSALGAAAAGVGPVALLVGDLAFLHDLGGLLAARRQALPLVIVLLDNDGGGIFSHLPIAERGEAVGFERFFRVPHGLDLEPVGALFGVGYERVLDWHGFRAALARALEAAGTTILHLKIDRDANLAHFRDLVCRVADAWPPEPSA